MFGKKKVAEKAVEAVEAVEEKAPKLSRKARRQMRKIEKKAAQNVPDADLNKMADDVVAGIAKVSPAAGKVAKKTAKAKPTQSVLRKIQKWGGKTTQIIAALAPTLIPLAYAAAGVLVTALKTRKKA